MKLLLPLVLDQAKEGRDSYVLYTKQVEILFKRAIFEFWGLISPPIISTFDRGSPQWIEIFSEGVL